MICKEVYEQGLSLDQVAVVKFTTLVIWTWQQHLFHFIGLFYLFKTYTITHHNEIHDTNIEKSDAMLATSVITGTLQYKMYEQAQSTLN